MNAGAVNYSRTESRNRAAIVIRFAEWLSEDGRRVGRRLTQQELAEALQRSKTTIGKYFPGDSWGALCQAAVAQRPNANPPFADEVLTAAADYRSGVALSPDPRRNPSVKAPANFRDFRATDLRKAIHDQTISLSRVAGASRELVERFLRPRLEHQPGDGDIHKRRRRAIKAANEIIECSTRLIERVTIQTSPDIRSDCVPIFDAAADAHRVRGRARETAEEMSELFRLHKLRKASLELTSDVRKEVDRAFATYYLASVDALLEHNPQHEFAAVRSLIDTLKEIGAHTDAPGDLRIDGDRLASAAARIAGYRIAYSQRLDRAGLNNLEDDLKALLTPGELRNEVTTLFHQTNLDASSSSLLEPMQLLRLARYRGVGDILIARGLVRVVRCSGPTKSARSRRALYFREGESEDLARQAILLRAEAFYARAISWFRTAGVAGELGRIADAESQRLRSSRPESVDDAAGTATDLPTTIADLVAALEQLIVNAIIRTEVSSTETFETGWTRFAHMIMEAAHFFNQPQRGLRTDLPPAY